LDLSKNQSYYLGSLAVSSGLMCDVKSDVIIVLLFFRRSELLRNKMKYYIFTETMKFKQKRN